MAAKPLILVVSDNRETRRAIADTLPRSSFDLAFASAISEALASLDAELISLVFCQDSLPDGSFRDVLYSLKTAGLRMPVVVCSVLGEIEDYLEAMQLGAFDFIPAPYRRSEVEAVVANALRAYWLKKRAATAGSTNSNSAFVHKVAS